MSGKVALATPDRRLCRNVIFTNSIPTVLANDRARAETSMECVNLVLTTSFFCRGSSGTAQSERR